MNVTPALQTILCAGVAHLVLPRHSTELLGRGAEAGAGLVIRERVRLKPLEPSPAPVPVEGVPK